jgi:hypothetical protein
MNEILVVSVVPCPGALGGLLVRHVYLSPHTLHCPLPNIGLPPGWTVSLQGDGCTIVVVPRDVAVNGPGDD